MSSLSENNLDYVIKILWVLRRYENLRFKKIVGLKNSLNRSLNFGSDFFVGSFYIQGHYKGTFRALQLSVNSKFFLLIPIKYDHSKDDLGYYLQPRDYRIEMV